MLEDLKPYRIRGWVLERMYAWVTVQIWGKPKHKVDCECGLINCKAWHAVDTFERIRRGIV